MTAFQLGPVVLSAPRFYAALGLVVLVLVAEWMAHRRRRDPQAPTDAAAHGAGTEAAGASWAWSAAFAVVLGARLGFVVENLGAFLQQPWSILAIWQGGFSPWWGIGLGAAVAAWLLRGSPFALRA